MLQGIQVHYSNNTLIIISQRSMGHDSNVNKVCFKTIIAKYHYFTSETGLESDMVSCLQEVVGGIVARIK